MNRFPVVACVAAVLIGLAPLALNAQAGRRGPAPLAIPHPHYVSIHLEITVDRPSADVWNKVGHFCQIGQWFQVPCQILSGQNDEVGEVRSVGNEILVGKTAMSYTYTQPVRVGQPYNLYHGTLEARPLTADSCQLLYTLVWDDSMLPSDAARQQDIASRRRLFTMALQNMKTIAEGGTVPPRRGGLGRGARGRAGAPAR